MEKGNLNVDYVEAITALKAVAKRFFLKEEYYRFLFKTKGLEFQGYRTYMQDFDDSSTIDWKASVRANKLLVRQYSQERDLKVAFIVDCGSNMVFGSTQKLKCEFAAEISAALATLTVESNNQLAFVLFNGSTFNYREFRGGKKQLQIFLDDLADGKNYGGESRLGDALDFAAKYLDKDTSTVFIVSDFLNLNLAGYRKIRDFSGVFDTIFLRITDPLDWNLPEVEGEFVLQSPGNSYQLLVNPKIARGSYARYTANKETHFQNFLKQHKIDYINLRTDKSFLKPMAIFLQERLDKVI
ncbi:DUF58 domain-containing protein [Candidatus Pacearchaeota archaeon]|nr:DUF58 domain-containing protein [Candidatus Pacearchaeota archaeon]